MTFANELSRRGVHAVMYVQRGPEERLQALHVLPDRNLALDDHAAFDVVAGAVSGVLPSRAVFCPKTVRNWKMVKQGLPRGLRLMTGLDRARPLVRIDISPVIDEIGTVTLPLKEIGEGDGGVRQYRGTWPANGLGREILQRMDRAIARTYERAERAVKRHGIRRFDMADHLNLEGAALAIAVARNGGEVHLWPHASNPIGVEYRAPIFKSVVVSTQLGAKAWRARFPQAEVKVSPETVFPPFTLDAPRDDNGVVNLVMFGIRGFLGALPRFDFAVHEASLKALVEAVAQADGLNFIYKSKDAPDAAWFREKIDPGGHAEMADVSFAKMAWPNMVFASPTIASTAVLEGICRGVPGMLLRETPAWDLVPVDTEVIPAEGVAALMDRLLSLRDPAEYAALAARQEAWLRSILKGDDQAA